MEHEAGGDINHSLSPSNGHKELGKGAGGIEDQKKK